MGVLMSSMVKLQDSMCLDVQAGSVEVVSSIARRALSLIADAGHLALPQPLSEADDEAAQQAQQADAGPPASQLFQPELQRVGCSAGGHNHSSGGHGCGTGSRSQDGASCQGSAVQGSSGSLASDLQGRGRQDSSLEAGCFNRPHSGSTLSRQPTAAAEVECDAGHSGTGLGPSPRAAALLKRLKAFMAEHILPAGTRLFQEPALA